MKKGSILFLLCIYIIPAISQTNSSRIKFEDPAPMPVAGTLLWRISGNGLNHPSYLFGTMHLNDKRLFNFDDSVYHAIERSEGLAIELNPDEMVAYMITKMFDDLTNSKKLEDVLSEDEYDKFSEGLAKKFKKPASELTVSDLVKEKNKWMTDYLEKGEMPTFVDAYLYNLARKQGKWVGGIEDLTDQTGLINNAVDRSDIEYMLSGNEFQQGTNEMLEKMIRLYETQDLNGLDLLLNTYPDAGQQDLKLIERNIKMTRRMDSLAALRTMFFAIGAAHLPGDSGVIRLLRQTGFTVEPVLSQKKIRSKDYKVRQIEIPWIEIKDESNLYNVSMPGNATNVKLWGMINMKFLFDIFSLSGFYTTVINNPSKITSEDSVFDNLARNVFSSQKKIPSKKIFKGEVVGREFIHKQGNQTLRLQVFIDNSKVYMVAMFSVKKEMLTNNDAKKFFESFTIRKQQDEVVASPVNFTDSIMGISLDAPAALTYSAQLSNPYNNEMWKISSYAGTDISTGSYILLFSKEIKPGYNILSDSLVYAATYENMSAAYDQVQRKDKVSGGIKLVEISGRQKANKDIYAKTVSAIIGNRNILLMVFGDSVQMQKPGVAAIYSSLRFIDPPHVTWKRYPSPDKAVSAWLPGNFRNVPGSFNNLNQVISYDSTTSTSFILATDTLSRYTWFASDSSFWKSIIKENAGNAVILSDKEVQNSGMKGREIALSSSTNDKIIKRVRILVNDSIMYRLSVSADINLFKIMEVNNFFETFEINRPGDASGFTRSKAALLFRGFEDNDPEIRRKASEAIENAPFSNEEVSLLHKAVFRSYRSSYDSAVSTSINRQLLHKLENNKSTLALIRETYPSLNRNQSELKGLTLNKLAAIHTRESYALLADLITSAPPDKSLPYDFQGNVTDSLALTAEILESLLSLSSDSAVGPDIAAITLALLDSGFIKRERFENASTGFCLLTDKLLPALRKKDADFNYNLYRLIELFGRYQTPVTIKALKSYLEVDNKYLLKQVILQLLQCGQPVPSGLIGTIAADKELRVEFHRKLKTINKAFLFPAKFLTQAYFAESYVWETAIDEDSPDTIVFITKKEAFVSDNKYSFYLYKVTYGKGEDANSYLGIAGGYGSGSKTEPLKDISGIYWTEQYEPAAINNQLNAYIKNLSKNEK